MNENKTPYRIEEGSHLAQSTNRYTRKGQFARELIPGLDVDTIKGMLRHEDKAWEKAEALLVKARTRS